MCNRRILIVTAVILLLVFAGCAEVEEEPVRGGTTPINLNYECTLYGTYQVTFMSVSCTNGESYTTSDDRVDEFRAFIGYEDRYLYRDFYLKADGEVLLNVADRRLNDEIESNFDSDFYQEGSYRITEEIYNVPVSDYHCDYRYEYKKISDSILLNYFRVTRSRSADSSENLFFLDEAELPDIHLEFGSLVKRFSN
jgi:hypothetical protein